ncbi:tRNA (adenosine(37)-N6)-threonylcarbamoyltransferase complex dimerization subunit type 1 TsaB [Saccharibacillus alkalitolerans]|uniref:tRNA (Adenosine(37)-N6)-threonylcarbamoyltransferase complex dimerization subunit type 1 TsaB n=1 Tax=Saccharibacillus alkalitolerans TaxID=2705290 RepID=A0ABX0F4A3_9BACL|nr:tRNA (adenosine(37)-N6)-threonylcarbamoyltransferase complex dimerization subunit type 1 TsaB [Saccharibacillus alkalitolerans]NGZ74829.1 tRNA (adenosine(37)-N6)-threonylcarbamoyltransferase complex dimerization subunit type 1 TsaB [Saccharibacillus alkalitolerans]
MEKHNRPEGRILALDTSSAAQAVAVLDENGVLYESCNPAERNHSVNLLPEIERALRESGTDKRELAGIAVGIGPGSYTGVRIAVTSAKTLAWALKLPIAAVSSLEAQAASGREAASPQGRGWIVPLVDARRGQAYTALFGTPELPASGGDAAEGNAPNGGTENAARLKRLADDAILMVDDWTARIADRLKKLPESERPEYVLFTGETEKHAETVRGLAELAGLRTEQVLLRDCPAEGRWIGRIGRLKLAAGETSDAHALLPNYTQVTEAEANLLRRP